MYPVEGTVATIDRIENDAKDTIDLDAVDTMDARVETIKSIWHMVDKEEDPAKTFQGLTYELRLNSSTKLLNISTFELRLLNFFKSYCIPLISFGVNMRADRTWRNQVPKLFLQSDLVRQSIFLFSSINLWPLCDFERLIDTDTDHSLRQDMERMGSAVDYKLLTENLSLEAPGQDPSNNLFLKTSKYFMNTLKHTGNILSRTTTGMQPDIDELTASELLVSGILIFSFLGIHPHRLVPLVSFNCETETDFLSIVRGVRNAIKASYKALATSDYFGILPMIDSSVQSNPITRSLRSQLSEYYDDQVKTSITSDNFATLLNSIATLELHMSKTIFLNYPVPLFAWILLVPDDFHDLIRAKHFFALRMLYLFACLCCLTKFQLYDSKNIWNDYIFWFKDYNFQSFNGYWNCEFDENLYRVIFERKFRIPNNSFHLLSNFDPNSFFKQ